MTEKLNNKWDIMLSLFTNKDTKAIFQNGETVTIKQLYSVNVIRQLLSRWLDSLQLSEPKNPHSLTRGAEQSKLCREFGNELYKAKPPKLRRAVEFYTKAIYLAPNDPSLPLSLAHANRAVALMALNLFQEAFDDCEMAVKYSYPKENILKVLFRQAGCSLELNNRAMLSKVIKLIENELKNNKSRGFYMKILMEYKAKMQNVKKTSNKANKESQEIVQKKSIKVEKSEEVGRYVRTTEKVDKDEAIMSDRAFAFVPVYEEYPDVNSMDMDCQNCAKTNVTRFPCKTCHRATYCSLHCRTEHVPIHQFECAGYQMNLWYYIGIAHLSIRTFLSGFPELVQKLSSEKDLSLTDAWARLMKLSKNASFKYGQVLGLVANFNKMADSKDFIRYSLTATMLVVYLKDKTDFFEKLPAECARIMKNPVDWELLAGSLIMLHMGQLVSNGHAITGLRVTPLSEFDCIEPPDSIKVGRLHCYVRSVRAFTGLFPSISLLNHSCEPNIWNSFRGSTLTIHASRALEAGEEVFNCYGPHYRLMDTAERRQALLEQYCFHCKCAKCEEVPEDKTHLQHFQCAACSERIYTDEARNYWWRNLDYRPKISCPKCGKRVSFRSYKEFLEQLGKLEAGEVHVVDAFTSMFDTFLNPKWGYNNELSLDSGIMILSHFIPFMSAYLRDTTAASGAVDHQAANTSSDEWQRLSAGLLGVARQLLQDREKKFGLYSIEYVIALTYYLDVVATQKVLNMNKCELEVDLEQMLPALQILAPEAKAIFDRYTDLYITKKEDSGGAAGVVKEK